MIFIAIGITLYNPSTVIQDIKAVINKTKALNLYTGIQNIITSTKCVKPHARINKIKSQNIFTNGNSPFFFLSRYNKLNGIAKYAAQIAKLEKIYNHP